ncbi:hypothetical protein Q9L42_007490 [Methylomarinum sp. Ch1-1]|uniref:Uncharacterized protein n=1 Tax=Methylomarinum roseum TaxID=3067653 RepID=A0AAU7NYE8_9GAMM
MPEKKSGEVSKIRFALYSLRINVFLNGQTDMEAAPIETLTHRLGQHLEKWFGAETCETLAKSSGLIQRCTSRLTGSDFFKSADGRYSQRAGD